MTTNQASAKTAFQLKGSVLTLSVLQILNPDPEAIEEQLIETIQKNPNFFKNMPIIIDLQKIYGSDYELNFSMIEKHLRDNGLVPVGISNANPRQTIAATEAGLGILSKIKTTTAPKNTQSKKASAKVITQPIRSGQQIYAKNADLIVLSSVSNGAEILADGNIHVYGALRGRAIAGMSGDTEARIFCQKLEAELICIAGYYKLYDDLKYSDGPNGTQIFLESGHITIKPIGIG